MNIPFKRPNTDTEAIRNRNFAKLIKNHLANSTKKASVITVNKK